MDTTANNTAPTLPLSWHKAAWLAVAVAAVCLSYAASTLPGIDWYTAFRPAALALLPSPYAAAPLFFGPPWLLVPLLPLAILPPEIGRGLFFILSLAGFLLAIRRLDASPLTAAAFLLSPPVFHCLLNANIDWLPILGATLPPQFGLFLVLAKPQMGAVVALFWLVEAWRKGRAREVVRVFAPVSIALLGSILLYGLWPLRMGGVTDIAQWNASLWPASIPVGLALAVAALRRRDLRFSLAAGPCLSPYAAFHSWSGAVAALARNPAEMTAAVAGLWIWIVMR